MSVKPLSYNGFSLDFLVAGSNIEKEGKRPGDNVWHVILTSVAFEDKQGDPFPLACTGTCISRLIVTMSRVTFFIPCARSIFV